MFMNDENKRHGKAIKIARETINNQKKKYNSVKYLQRQQFSFTKTSKTPESLSVKLISRLPGTVFTVFEGELLEASKSPNFFLSTAKFITKYSSDIFFLSVVRKYI